MYVFVVGVYVFVVGVYVFVVGVYVFVVGVYVCLIESKMRSVLCTAGDLHEVDYP